MESFLEEALKFTRQREVFINFGSYIFPRTNASKLGKLPPSTEMASEASCFIPRRNVMQPSVQTLQFNAFLRGPRNGRSRHRFLTALVSMSGPIGNRVYMTAMPIRRRRMVQSEHERCERREREPRTQVDSNVCVFVFSVKSYRSAPPCFSRGRT